MQFMKNNSVTTQCDMKCFLKKIFDPKKIFNPKILFNLYNLFPVQYNFSCSLTEISLNITGRPTHPPSHPGTFQISFVSIMQFMKNNSVTTQCDMKCFLKKIFDPKKIFNPKILFNLYNLFGSKNYSTSKIFSTEKILT